MPIPQDPNRLLGTRAACMTALRVASVIAWILAAAAGVRLIISVMRLLSGSSGYGLLALVFAFELQLLILGALFLRRASRVAAVGLLVWDLASFVTILVLRGFHGAPLAVAELIVFIVASVAAFRWHALAADGTSADEPSANETSPPTASPPPGASKFPP
jgi:hypothetical protein